MPEALKGRHILNSGGAYGGFIKFSTNGKIRYSPRRPEDRELPMLAQHVHQDVIGAWQQVDLTIIDGRPFVTAGDLRWANTELVEVARRYLALWNDDLIHAISIGFRGDWFWCDELPKDHPAYSESGGLYVDDWEVYEASQVAVGADDGAHRALQLADGSAPVKLGASGSASASASAVPAKPKMAEPVTADAALALTPGDKEEVAALARDIAADMARQLLQRHHGMTEEEADAAVQRILDGAAEPEAEAEQSADATLFEVPDALREAAQRGLDAAEEYGRADSGAGIDTAEALVSGQVDAAKVVEMNAWWARFKDMEPDEDTPEGEPSNLEIRWDQWGGNPAGADWAAGHVEEARKQIEDGDNGEEEMAALSARIDLRLSREPVTPPRSAPAGSATRSFAQWWAGSH